MIIIKTGVVFNRLLPEIYNLFPLLDQTFTEAGAQCWITSANDSTHMQGSRHYTDQALDIRSRVLRPDQKESVLAELRHKLGSQYDVLLEGVGTPQEHFHLEKK